MGCGLRGSAQMLEKAQATEHFTKSRGARQRAPLRDAILSMTNMHSYSTGPRKNVLCLELLLERHTYMCAPTRRFCPCRHPRRGASTTSTKAKVVPYFWALVST